MKSCFWVSWGNAPLEVIISSMESAVHRQPEESRAEPGHKGVPAGAAPREIADEHSASDEYAARFSGVAGAWLLSVQERILRLMVRGRAGTRVLDVGGGHGQVAGPLAQDGFSVTVLGSSEKALHQVEPLRRKSAIDAVVGNLLNIPFPERHFGVVTCFRLVPHCDHWRRLIAELCRVSRDCVIIDYPSSVGLNALSPLLFSIKKGVEGNTRPYALFTPREVRAEFARWGFELKRTTKQFFWPMVMHRMLKSPRISSIAELVPRIFGLTALFGSPVIAQFVRRDLAVSSPRGR